MAIVVRFASPNFTEAIYAETVKKLEAAGAGSPPGRLYHVCFGDKASLRVSDIWESREAFDKFSETLRPILTELGVQPGDIEFFDVHNIIAGKNVSGATP